ncbi:PLC-like phosphodiesterase [Lichtheimia hyalospora FSU 10163]|nr:PLC-like phosphodiesterase [Lichtheimia hyalospora FSU 10163]
MVNYWKLTTALLAASISLVTGQQLCNGYSELCNKSYNELTYVLTHNSYAFMANPAANQQCSIDAQLADGVRALKLSAVKAPDGSDKMYLCHTSCTILNAGAAVDTLRNITTWLKDNPNEVISIFWNFPNNDFFAPDFEEPYKESGLIEYSHVQNVNNMTWPTLGEMIAANKRVVSYMDMNADQTNYPWMHAEFSYMFETPYENNNASSFSCVIDRPDDPTDPASMMYGMNHFLYGNLPWGEVTIQIPQSGSAGSTNSEDSLMKQASQCRQTFGSQPNFLIVDFYNKGQTLQIAAELNNVTFDTSKELQCDKESAKTSSNTGDTSDASFQSLSSLSFLLFSLASIMLVFA